MAICGGWYVIHLPMLSVSTLYGGGHGTHQCLASIQPKHLHLPCHCCDVITLFSLAKAARGLLGPERVPFIYFSFQRLVNVDTGGIRLNTRYL